MLQYSGTQRTGEPPINVVFHALSDANRRAMIDRLLDGPASVSEIAPLALSTAERWISERRATWEARLDRLGEFLAADTDESGPSTQSKKTRSKRRSK